MKELIAISEIRVKEYIVIEKAQIVIKKFSENKMETLKQSFSNFFLIASPLPDNE